MYANLHLQNLNNMISFSNGNIIKIYDDSNIKLELESIFYNNTSKSLVHRVLDIYHSSFSHYLNIINISLVNNFKIIDTLTNNDISTIIEKCNNIIFLLKKSDEGYKKFINWCSNQKKIYIDLKYIEQNKYILQEFYQCKQTISAFENCKLETESNKKEEHQFAAITDLIDLYHQHNFTYPLINFLKYLKNIIVNLLFKLKYKCF